MDHIGMDVHKKESQLCILTEAAMLDNFLHHIRLGIAQTHLDQVD